jgi:hypothetical protein
MNGSESKVSMMNLHIPDWRSKGAGDRVDRVVRKVWRKVVGLERSIVVSDRARFAENVSPRGHGRTDDHKRNVLRRNEHDIDDRVSFQRRNPLVDHLVGRVAKRDVQDEKIFIGEFAQTSSRALSGVQDAVWHLCCFRAAAVVLAIGSSHCSHVDLQTHTRPHQQTAQK